MMSKKLSIYTGLGIILALLMTSWVYWQHLDGPFLLDDGVNINDAYISSATLEELLYTSTHNTSGIFGRPISAFSLALSGLMHGPDSWGYKYHNLLLHLLTGLLIFWFLLQLLPVLCRKLTQEKVVILASAVTLSWLLHPLMVSTVLYAVQRMAQLSAFFTVMALLLYVIARKIVASKFKTFLFLAYFCFPMAMLCAVLSKENGALVPLYVLAIEYIAFQFSFQSGSSRKRVWWFLSIFVVIPVILGSIYISTHLSQVVNYSNRDFSLIERLYSELHIVSYYIKWILLPQLGDMSLFHDDIAVVREFGLSTLLFLLFYIVCISSIFIFRKKASVLALGIAWFLISHIMESTFIPLELVFEHRNYLAALGLLLIVFYYLLRIPKKNAFIATSIIVIGFFTALTAMRAKVWGNEELIYSIALIDHPDSKRAHNSWANIQYNKGNYDSAIEHLDITFELDKTDAGALLHQIVLSCVQNKMQNELFLRAKENLANYPISAYSISSFNHLVTAIVNKGCIQVSAVDALSLIQSSLSQPDNLQLTRYFAFLKRFEGQLYMLSGDYDRGVLSFFEAYQADNYVLALIELGAVQISLELFADADKTIKMIEQANSGFLGNEDKALRDLRESYRLAQENQSVL